MPSVKFKELGLKLDKNTTSISIPITQEEKVEIEVRKAISMDDKIDLIETALEKAEEDGIYNDMKLEVYFHLNIIYLYTNLEFDEEDRADEMDLYDRLRSNGVIEEVCRVVSGEYQELWNFLQIMKKDNLEYKNSAAAVLRSIVQDLPKNAAAAKEILDSFDPTKYQQVADFAIAANGGRNIRTNQPVEEQTVPVSTAADDSSIESSPNKIVSLTKKES